MKFSTVFSNPCKFHDEEAIGLAVKEISGTSMTFLLAVPSKVGVIKGLKEGNCILTLAGVFESQLENTGILINKGHMVRRRKAASQIAKSESIEEIHDTPAELIVRTKWRLSKRSLCITILTTMLVWILCPVVFPSFRNVNFQMGMDYFSESAIFDLLPPLPISTDIMRNLTSLLRPFSSDPEVVAPGVMMTLKGAKAHFPVFLVPGIISTGLELWKGEPCSKDYFRQRLWGTLNMFRLLVTDKKCWIKHLSLDAQTGLDPEGIKIRAALGLEAADFLLPGFWVWGKMIENLAQVGYDSNNLYLAAFDWRLTYSNMEKRDGYFSKLKANLEVSLKTTGRKAVVVSHSMGSQVWHFFMKWVESEKGGKGGKRWIDNHIHTQINIAGPLLGAPKTVSAILSGESKDTAQLGMLESYILELFFSKEERRDIFRSWGGVSSIMPRGGDVIWGNSTFISDHKDKDVPFGEMVQFSDSLSQFKNTTVGNISTLFKQTMGQETISMIENNYSLGVAYDLSDPKYDDPKYWSNPLESSLPEAPNMKMYSVYGIGKSSERGYVYKETSPEKSSLWETLWPMQSEATTTIPTNGTHLDSNRALHIDTSVSDESKYLVNGIYYTDGDGSVPVISSGYMCIKGWTIDRYNPSKIKCITREYPHNPLPLLKDLRGGPKTSDHVDILGNHDLTLDILRIVCNFDLNVNGELDSRIYSEIREYSEKIPLQ